MQWLARVVAREAGVEFLLLKLFRIDVRAFAKTWASAFIDALAAAGMYQRDAGGRRVCFADGDAFGG